MLFSESAVKITFEKCDMWYGISSKKLYCRIGSYFMYRLLRHVADIMKRHIQEDADWAARNDLRLNIFFDCFADPGKIKYQDCQIYSNLLGVHYLFIDEDDIDLFNALQARVAHTDLHVDKRERLTKISLCDSFRGEDIKLFRDFEQSFAAKRVSPPKNNFTFANFEYADGCGLPLFMSAIFSLFFGLVKKSIIIGIIVFGCGIIVFTLIFNMFASSYHYDGNARFAEGHRDEEEEN